MSALNVKFIPSPRLYPDLALMSAGYLARRGPEAKAEAQANSPVDSGDFRDSIDWRVVTDGGVPALEVIANIDYAAHVEFGTEDTPVFAPLRRMLGEIVR